MQVLSRKSKFMTAEGGGIAEESVINDGKAMESGVRFLNVRAASIYKAGER